MAASKTHFPNVPRPFWAPRGDLGGAPMAPRLGLAPPLEIASPRVRLPVFGVPGGPPQKTPLLSKHTYLLWFLMIFRRNGARKRDSREHHRFSDAPPGGTNEPPEKCARAPGTQKKTPGPRRGPRDPARSPPGGPGAPPGDLCRSCNTQFPAPGVTWICKGPENHDKS